MKAFDIPFYYKSPLISRIKELRKQHDSRKKDYSPTLLDFGPVRFFIARHFGFCYGVENAIEISYKALKENPGKRIFLLSQMIHNPEVNNDLERHGIRFIMDPEGNPFIGWEQLSPGDIVIIPAFGATLETKQKLKDLGIEIQRYNTTCPFVERVWNRSEELGKGNYTVIIHGKQDHEETRATFSHSRLHGPSLIIRDMREAGQLAQFIAVKRAPEEFFKAFLDRYSLGFDPAVHLTRIGVVNQTTMLATETKKIAAFLRNIMKEKYGAENLSHHFADTRDTLCYATNDNQDATLGLLQADADFVIVVGGYNSSNTSHIADLCMKKFTTYYISSAREILSAKNIRHYDHCLGQVTATEYFLPAKKPVTIAITSGASCPDASVEEVLQRILSFFDSVRTEEEVIAGVEMRIGE